MQVRWKQRPLRSVRPAPAPRRQRSRLPRANPGLLSTIGSLAGEALAPGIGGKWGGLIGRGGAAIWNRITGHGDYSVTSNTLVHPGEPVPSFGDDSIRVKRREYLGDVFGSTGFVSQRYPINPGLATTFPWLSSIASNYEQYKINGLIFEFVSTSANALNSTNTALGKLVMATNYNAVEPPFPSTRYMLATKFSNYGMPSSNLPHAIECAPGTTPTECLFVRSGAPALGSDLRLYDLADFQLATEGMQASANIGGLWVSYDISLMKPVIGTGQGSIPTQSYLTGATSSGLFANVVDNGPELGAIPCTLTNPSTGLSVLELVNPVPGSAFLCFWNMPSANYIFSSVKFVNLTPLYPGSGFYAVGSTASFSCNFAFEVPVSSGPFQILIDSYVSSGATLSGLFGITQINSFVYPGYTLSVGAERKTEVFESPEGDSGASPTGSGSSVTSSSSSSDSSSSSSSSSSSIVTSTGIAPDDRNAAPVSTKAPLKTKQVVRSGAFGKMPLKRVF